MLAWHRGKAFLTLLEHQREKITQEKGTVENRLVNIALDIERHQQDRNAITRQINDAIPPGILSRREIYQGIRQQSVLLTRQQDIIQHVIDLQNEQATLMRQLQHCRDALTRLDKRHYKISFYLQRVRREVIRQADISAESEIQEIAGYGGKNNEARSAHIAGA